MSEQVTVIVHGKFYERDGFEKRFLAAEKGDNLLYVLKKNGYYATDCSGNGTCGKCVVRYVQNAPLPTMNERSLLGAEQLRDGYRLACRHALMQDTEVVLCALQGKLPSVVTEANAVAVSQDQSDIAGENATKKADGTDGKSAKTVFYVADIGTTTVAMQAVRGSEVLATYTALNTQRSLGADVASRISAATEGHLEELTEAVRACVEDGVSNLAEQCGVMPEFVVIAGNTVMNYLFRARSPKVLGHYPFGPVDTEAAQMVLHGICLYLIPGISAFVGGDVLAGVRAFDMIQTQQTQLLVDLGTNGEMVLSRNGTLFCTATAAGPAFESGVSGSFMGADFIKAVSKLLEQGIVDETGLMQEPYFTQGTTVDGITIKQEDIRELQKAKAAVALGIELLCKRGNVKLAEIEKIYLAGGLGYYLSPESAIRIGMFPECFRGKICAVGNSALLGARRVGELLTACGQGERLNALQHACNRIQGACHCMNLAEEADFAQQYVERLSFPGTA